jgi:hypothetical protein
MDVLTTILVILHFVGLASLLGSFLFQLSAPKKLIVPGMFHGILTQLVTGIALVGIASAAEDSDVDHVKVGVKLLVALVVAALVIAYRKRESVSAAVWWTIGALSLLNVVVAVAWN